MEFKFIKNKDFTKEFLLILFLSALILTPLFLYGNHDFENYEKFYTSKFEKNKIVGFIKSKNSWHDVSKIHTKSSSRKSLNINLYLIN